MQSQNCCRPMEIRVAAQIDDEIMTFVAHPMFIADDMREVEDQGAELHVANAEQRGVEASGREVGV